MKKIIILMFLLVSFSFVYAEDVVFATGEWAPFTSKNQPDYGYVTELVTAICKEAGITPVYKFYPWLRAEMTLDTGESFAAFPYALTEKTKAKYNISDVFFFGENVFMYYEDNKAITDKIKSAKSITEMKGLVFGSQLGSFVKKDFVENGIKFSEVSGYDQLVKMLETKRIDMIMDEKTVLYHTVQNTLPQEISKFKILDASYGPKMPNVLAVSKKYPNTGNILKRFNAGLKKIKANGTYNKIIQKNHMSGI